MRPPRAETQDAGTPFHFQKTEHLTTVELALTTAVRRHERLKRPVGLWRSWQRPGRTVRGRADVTGWQVPAALARATYSGLEAPSRIFGLVLTGCTSIRRTQQPIAIP
jgi:hypothetical protein